MDRSLESKVDRLEAALRDIGRVVVAFSGGVDSAFLMAAAHETLGSAAVAVTAVSPSLARRELQDARDLASRLGWSHRTVRTNEVSREEYAVNDGSRCYWCKSELFDVLGPVASDFGGQLLVGTNHDDLGDYRPGIAAATERGIRAPLVEAGLSKSEIRAVSRAWGLPTAEKPASPCLSSRVAYGVRVTPTVLRRIERAEAYVRSLGFDVLRVRDHGGRAVVEVEAADVTRARELEHLVVEHLRELGFEEVEVSQEGFRSGSLNALLDTPRFASRN